MKTAVALALTAAMADAQNKTNSTKCISILDPASPANKLIQTAMVPTSALKAIPEAWQTCIGSLDTNPLIAEALGAFTTQPTCAAASPYLMPLLTGAPTTSNTTFLGGEEPGFLNITDAHVQKLCTPMVKSILPCLNTAILAPLFKQVNSNPCCTQMIADIKSLTGNAPDALVDNALKLTTNVVCSSQTPGFNGTANQTCGYSWYKSFVNGIASTENISKFEERIFTSLQVPNDQGCAAVQGEPFKSTTGATVTSLFTKPIVPGSCARPADDLLTWVRKFPVWQNFTLGGGAIRPLDLFEDGKCVNGTQLIKAVPSAKDFFQFFRWTSYAKASCFHLSNGAFGTCKFSDSSSGSIKDNSTAPAATPKASSSEIATASLVISSLAFMSSTW